MRYYISLLCPTDWNAKQRFDFIKDHKITYWFDTMREAEQDAFMWRIRGFTVELHDMKEHQKLRNKY